MFVIYGIVRKWIVLGWKRDWCEVKGDLADHTLVRQLSIADVFWIPVAPIWVSHHLRCDACGRRTKIGLRQARAALRAERLPLPPRPEWPAHARAVFEATGRMPQEAELDRLTPNPRRGPWDTYLQAWLVVVPFLVATIVVLAIVT